MKRFLILPTLILPILFGCSEVNENIDTNSGHYEDNASNVANTISKLSPGIYTINVFGEITPVTIFNIKAAMINNPNAKISLDLSNTTGLLGIESEAFMGCDNLINITIPNNIGYIGNHAFSCCNNLINITIPDSVTNIGYCAFDSCNSLTNIIIPNGVTDIGNDAFTNCNNLKSVTFENTTGWYHSDNEDNTDLMPINVTNESDNAAYLRDIHTGYWYRKITITTTANNIENIIPKHLIGIYTICINGEIDAITLYNIKTIVINNSNAKIFLDLSNTTGLLELDSESFSECHNLTNIILPNTVTYIGDRAFYNCYNLESIIIPDSVTSIGSNAFSYCKNLTNISIPDSVTHIGNYAFDYCNNLESVTIGSGVTTIGTNAFKECNNLKSVTFENTNDWYYSNEDNTDLTLINVTNESDNATYLRNIHTNYWYRKNIINTTTNDIKNAISELPAGLYTINVNGEINTTTIANIKSAMINNPNAKISLDLSNTTGLQEIDNEAFMGCNNLINITIPNNIDYIGNHAFSSCNNLVNITIPDSVTNIQSNAFNSCNSLTSIIIPNSVTSIGDSAFEYCGNLENVTIGSGVTTIGTNAFNECNNLTSVIFENTTDWYHSDNEDYTDNTLVDVTNESNNAVYLRNIHPNYWCRKNTINTTTNDIENAISELPAGLYTINTSGKINTTTIANIKAAIIDNSNAKIFLDLSNTTGLLELDSESFSGCHNLTNIILPNTVTYIGDRAFYSCYNLESIIIPDSVTSIGESAFGYCYKLTNITFADTTSTWYYTSSSDYTDGTAIDVTDAATNATNLTETYYSKYWYKEASSIE